MSYMNYGVKPDIVSMAKGLGGGMPIGAICATAEVAKAFTPGSHGTTFGGHPVSCAAALAEVNELIDRPFLHKTAETIRLGTGIPQIFNDEVVVPAFLNRGVSLEDATLDDMEAARNLYTDLGFESIDPYYHNPIVGAHYLKADIF